MPDFLKSPFVDGPGIAPLEVLVRLLIALALGALVAWIYRATRKSAEMSASFTVTLVLLAILIAMVTQVIGDNIARAFSLVGALLIVRFRTVVRDTQDTAYEARLRRTGSADELVKALNRIEGVQSVQLQRRDFEQD